MANAHYRKGAERQLKGEIAYHTDTIVMALMANTYTPNLTTHEYLTDLGANVLATVTLTGRTVTNGVFDADDPVFAAVTAGSTTNAVVTYKSTGVAATSPLLMYHDQITDFPVATNGGDITARITDAVNKIMKV